MNISKPNLDSLAPKVVALTENAGSLLRQLYEGEIFVSEKRDGSPVTQADHQSHWLLKEGLEKLTPDIPVISEEDESSWTINKDLYWLIDPLDGTKGFIHKTGEFCINVALMEKDHPLFGLIHIPLTQQTFYGYESKALCHFEGKSSSIRTRISPPEGMTLLVGGNEKSFKKYEGFFLKSYPIAEIKRIRSAIKFCKIASGCADLYVRFEPCGEWDTAAGQALVEAAGGIMTKLDGTSFLYRKPDLINEEFVVFGHKP